jgi:hypothetical protein
MTVNQSASSLPNPSDMTYRRALLMAEVQELRAKLGVMVQRLINSREDAAASYADSAIEYLDHSIKDLATPRPEKKKKR